MVGDSVAYGYGFGLTGWARGRSDLRAVNGGQLGCPIARGGSYRFLRDIGIFEDRCDWSRLFPKFMSEQDPDVVVLSSGIWEVVDRRLPGDDRWRHIGQPEVDRYLLREFLSAIDTLGSDRATVVLLTYPHFQAGADQGYTDLPESDPARVDRLNELMAEAAGLRPGVATVVDVQAWLAQQPGGERTRPSGRTACTSGTTTCPPWRRGWARSWCASPGRGPARPEAPGAGGPGPAGNRGQTPVEVRGADRGTTGASRPVPWVEPVVPVPSSWYSSSTLTDQMSWSPLPRMFSTVSIAVSIEWSWLLYLCMPLRPDRVHVGRCWPIQLVAAPRRCRRSTSS